MSDIEYFQRKLIESCGIPLKYFISEEKHEEHLRKELLKNRIKKINKLNAKLL